MIEKNIKSRIVHKHDTEANWLKAINFTPKLGEIIIYDIDDKYTYQRVKIGDGINNVNDLPFIMHPVALSGSYKDLKDTPLGEFKVDADGNVYVCDKNGMPEETDPTVPAWAKEPNKPTYTAEEVGALPASTPIPSIEGLATEEFVNNKLANITVEESIGVYSISVEEIEISDDLLTLVR